MNSFKAVDDYINSFDGLAREKLQMIRQLIHEVVPDTTELINYQIAAYTLVEGGKRDQQIMMAAFKKHVGFYPHPTTMEYFWDQLGDYKKAKGSVQFPLDKPLPVELIKAMIRYRLDLLTKE